MPAQMPLFRNMIIKRLETFLARLDPPFLFPCFLSHSVATPFLPPFTARLPLCCTIIPVKPRVVQGEKTPHCSQSVSLGLCNCSQTNQSRTASESQHGSVFPHLLSCRQCRIRSAPPFSPQQTSSLICCYISTLNASLDRMQHNRSTNKAGLAAFASTWTVRAVTDIA